MTDDELEIRRLIEQWAVCRDSGDWDGMAAVWAPGGRMKATWFEGAAEDFVKASQEGWQLGVNVTHFLGGSYVVVAGDRAIAQTKMAITQRVVYQDCEIDIICTGRFVDFFSRDSRWGLQSRKLIYENDRVATVSPGAPVTFDRAELARFPRGYRHLGYIQSKAGMKVATNLPGRTGPEVESLLAEAARWLKHAA